MASASKTTNLNLPQWLETEKPERTDFNAAFDAIDTELWQYIYPVGCIYETTNLDFDPNTHFGGTWSLYGNGRVLVGIDSSDSDFDEIGNNGGSKTHTLTTTELPQHQHDTIDPPTFGSNHLYHSAYLTSNTDNYKKLMGAAPTSSPATSAGTLKTSNTGGGGAHNNLPPYIVVARWRRTA